MAETKKDDATPRTARTARTDDDAPRIAPEVAKRANEAFKNDPDAGAGATRTTLGPDADITPTRVGDPEGIFTNRVEGTIQREPTPEELPPDAKIAPVAEQLNPNGAAQAVGALPTPDEVSGVKQPGEGKKVLTEDMSDATEFLPPKSKQEDRAKLAMEDAERDADRGIV